MSRSSEWFATASLPLKFFDVFSSLTHQMYHKWTTWTCEMLIDDYSVIHFANTNLTYPASHWKALREICTGFGFCFELSDTLCLWPWSLHLDTWLVDVFVGSADDTEMTSQTVETFLLLDIYTQSWRTYVWCFSINSGEVEAAMATWRRSLSEVVANGLSQGTVLTLTPFCKSFAPAANNDLGESRLQDRLLTNCLLHWCVWIQIFTHF